MNKIDNYNLPLKVFVLDGAGIEAEKERELALHSAQQLRNIKRGLNTEDVEVTFDSMRVAQEWNEEMCVMLTPHDLNPPKIYKT